MEILNVLIVEDIPMAQKLCQMIIHDALKTPSDIASDGQEALEKAMKKQYDLILMDIGLPILNGIEATRAIRDYEKQNNRSPTIIIALTANEKADIKEECFLAGMNEYVSKPFSEEKAIAIKHRFFSN